MLGVDIQVTREDDTIAGADGKISHRMVWCSAFVHGVRATREDDVVIGAIGKISHSIVHLRYMQQFINSHCKMPFHQLRSNFLQF